MLKGFYWVFFLRFPLLDKLSLLKQTRTDGQVQRLHIITEVCPKWKETGDLMGVSVCCLEAIEKNRRIEVKECFRDFFLLLGAWGRTKLSCDLAGTPWASGRFGVLSSSKTSPTTSSTLWTSIFFILYRLKWQYNFFFCSMICFATGSISSILLYFN